MKKLLRDSLPETIGGLTAGLVAWIFSTLYGLFEIDSRPVFVWGIVAITIYMILGWALIYVLRAKRVVEKLEPPQFVYRFQGSKRLAAISISILTSIAIGWIWFNFAWYNPTFKNVGGILILQIAGDTEDKSLRRELVSALNVTLNQERDLNIEVMARNELIDEVIGIKSAHEQARKLGKEQKATLVVWGNRIGDKKFYPRITIVDERMRVFFEVERTLQVQNISELNLPPELVDQPLYLTLFVSGYVLYSRKEYDNAVKKFKAALAQAESGGEGLNEVRYNSTFLIGTSLYERFRYREAADEFRNALIFATNSKDSATALNNSAVALQLGGNYLAAEPLYRRALTIVEKQLGLEHPNVAASLNNLASLLHAQGKYSEAEPLFRHALAIGEKQLGPEHPDVATNLNNLASLLQAQGKYIEAEPLYRRALKINEKQLGPEHPSVAQSLNNLASLLRAQGRYSEAELLFHRALAILEKQMGLEHPQTKMVRKNLEKLQKHLQ